MILSSVPVRFEGEEMELTSAGSRGKLQESVNTKEVKHHYL